MRASTYQSRPPERYLELKESLVNKKFYLIGTSGPTVFKIRDEEGSTFKVVLGNPHSCSCKSSKDCCDALLCVHKVFCLLKVVRILETSPMSWQTSMTDSEIVQMLDGVFSAKKAVPRRVRSAKQASTEDDAKNSNDNTNKVKRQPVQNDSEEDICPICQDTMNVEQALTWCRVGCGNNIHAKCMILYTQHKNSKKDSGVLCPLCRMDWGPAAIQHIREDSKSSEIKYSCATVTCRSCHVPMRGIFYRCIECSQMKSYEMGSGSSYFDTCQRCFSTSQIEKDHRSHHMLEANAALSMAEHTWDPVVQRSRSTASEELLRSLQTRDFNASDYDLLLSLDANTAPSLASFISESFAAQPNPQISTLCWCGEIGHLEKRRILFCCGSTVHASCLINSIDNALIEGHSTISTIKCPNTNCKRSVLLGLCRKRRKKKPNDSAKQTNTSSEQITGGQRDLRNKISSNALMEIPADLLRINLIGCNEHLKTSGW